MFLFKKILGSLVLPLPFCLLVMCVGWVLLWRGKKPALGKMMSLIGFIALILFSLTPVADRIEAPLKYRFSAYGMGEKALYETTVRLRAFIHAVFPWGQYLGYETFFGANAQHIPGPAGLLLAQTHQPRPFPAFPFQTDGDGRGGVPNVLARLLRHWCVRKIKVPDAYSSYPDLPDLP